MELLAPVVATCAPCAGACGLGWFLRQSICDEIDGETAAKFATLITFPALVLQSFNSVPLSSWPTLVPLAYAVVTACSAGIAWILSRNLHPKERGLLAGASIGSSASLFSVPLAGALFGMEGLRVALLCSSIALFSSHFASYLLFSTAGAAFPENYKHIDGGSYRGEWKGMLKEGYGVYSYPSGARYEGEWREGVKEGRGVYYFPKGGLYEGEWRSGSMAGIGVRTYSSGKVRSGVWEGGKLAQSMEEWQCALAVEGANEAASVAKRIVVGGGSASAALSRLGSQPATWAIFVAMAMSAAHTSLTPTLQFVVSKLAEAHAPLALVAVGLSLDVIGLSSRQVKPTSMMLGLRLGPPLLAALVAIHLTPFFGWDVRTSLIGIGSAVMCFAAPVASTTLHYAHLYRLNENLAAAITMVSTAWGLVLLPVLGISAGISFSLGNILPFSASLGASVVVLALTIAMAGVGGSQSGRSHSGKVKMVYQGGWAPAKSPMAPEQPPEPLGNNTTELCDTNTRNIGEKEESSAPHQPANPEFTDVDGPSSPFGQAGAGGGWQKGSMMFRLRAPQWGRHSVFLRSCVCIPKLRAGPRMHQTDAVVRLCPW